MIRINIFADKFDFRIVYKRLCLLYVKRLLIIIICFYRHSLSVQQINSFIIIIVLFLAIIASLSNVVKKWQCLRRQWV